MRLIDIDALPEDCWWCGDAIKEAINNAPTIETESKYLISIQDAIDAFKEFRGWMAKDKAYEYVCKLKKLPSAQSERSVIEDEVWGFVRIITDMTEKQREECFGGSTCDLDEYMTYKEAKAKYEAWKKEKEEIHVGDELKDDENIRAVVLDIIDEDYMSYEVFTENGITDEWHKKHCKKTGRHFDEVEELLMKMKEKQNDT